MASAAFLLIAVALSCVLLVIGEPGLALLTVVVLILGLAFDRRTLR